MFFEYSSDGTLVKKSPAIDDSIVRVKQDEPPTKKIKTESSAEMSSRSSIIAPSSAHADVLAQWSIDLDDLKIGDELGSGAFGVVRSASFRGTQVAVKILHSTSEKAKVMFQKEASILLYDLHSFIPHRLENFDIPTSYNVSGVVFQINNDIS